MVLHPNTPDPMTGGAEALRGALTSFFSDGDYGVFGLGLDATDPGRPGGLAVLFSGDDGHFWERHRFAAAHLDELAEIVGRASRRAESLCVRSHGIPVLRSRDSAPFPVEIPGDVRFRHPGLAAIEKRFAAVIGPPEHNPAFTLYGRDDDGGNFQPVFTASIRWLGPVGKVVAEAARAVDATAQPGFR